MCRDDDAGRLPETASAQPTVGQRTVIEQQRGPQPQQQSGTRLCNRERWSGHQPKNRQERTMDVDGEERADEIGRG